MEIAILAVQFAVKEGFGEGGPNLIVCSLTVRNYRYLPCNKLIKELIDQGAIGDIQFINHMEQVGFWHFAHSYVRGNWVCKDWPLHSSPHPHSLMCSVHIAPVTCLHPMSWRLCLSGRPKAPFPPLQQSPPKTRATVHQFGVSVDETIQQSRNLDYACNT